MKKVLVIALTAVMAFALAACGSKAEEPAADAGNPEETPAASSISKVGISLPTKNEPRWVADSKSLENAFAAAGIEIDMQFAGDNNAQTQAEQIDSMISGGVDVLIIAAVESSSLGAQLQAAADAGITVISYDRLMVAGDTADPNVDYYLTFDNYQVGVIQAQYVIDRLGLDNAEGPFNIEFLAGDPGDNNAGFFFNGAYDTLASYIDDGVLVVKSGETTFAQVAVAKWTVENAQKRMETLISGQKYGPNGTKLDVVLCSNDTTAYGALNALKAAGYTPENVPIVTGQDGNDVNLNDYVSTGYQAMFVFKNTADLAAKTVEFVTTLAAGGTPEVTPGADADYGVATYLCTPVACDINNYEDVLLASGTYTYEDGVWAAA